MRKIWMILLSSLFLQGCFFQDQNSTIHHEDTRFMMDTIVTIETTGKSEDTLKSTTDKAFAAFQEIADETDSYAPHGPKDLYAINEKAGTVPQKAAPHLLAILKSAASHPHQELSLTLGPVIKIWNDNREKKTVPSRAEIADALTLTKGSRVRIDETTGTLTLMPGTQIDLGAVAKGYAVEEAAKVLQKEGGFQTALINAGGNIKVLGEKPDHKPWRIGIQDPKDPEKVLGTLSVPPGTAIATSGDYQRYYEVSGVRYHHILNPQTGWPSRNAHSVTVVTQSACWADFYSTLLFVMTPKDAMTLVENNPSLEMVYQDLDGTLHISSGLKDLFVQGQ